MIFQNISFFKITQNDGPDSTTARMRSGCDAPLRLNPLGEDY